MTPGARTKLAAVIGHPVGHSRSPALHNAAYAALGLDAVYLAFDVAPDGLGAAIHGASALSFLGLNVTVPHKEAAMALCDEVDETARLVGAVNTIVFQDQKLRGFNTDVEGFSASLDESVSAAPRRAVVLGSGGAARAVTVALGRRGVPCAIVARDLERGRGLLGLGAVEVVPWTDTALDAALDGVDLLVDATSAGLHADREAALPAPIPVDRLDPGALVATLVYHREPALVAQARARGLRVLDGAGMLVHQAARALTLMTGRAAALDAMWTAFRSADGAHR